MTPQGTLSLRENDLSQRRATRRHRCCARTLSAPAIAAGLAILAAGCGASTAPTQSSTADETLPERSAVSTTSLVEGEADTALAADTDITALPTEMYRVDECEPVRFSPRTQPDPSTEFSVAPYLEGVGDFEDRGFGVYRATVARIGDPLMASPVDLPTEFLEQVGATTGDDLATPWSPFEVTVDETFAGTELDRFTTAELGCIAAGVLPTLVVGSDLVFVTESTESGTGVGGLFGGDQRLVDWYGIDESGRLTPRESALGGPPLAPFLVDEQVSTLAELFAGE